jgi:ATP-dependent RNA helicase DDX52/ROK1
VNAFASDRPLVAIGLQTVLEKHVIILFIFHASAGMQEPGKIIALKQIIKAGIRPPVLLFVSSKERAKSLHAELQFEGIHVDSIHADNCQSARAASVEKFRAGKTWLLVATDLIARGMDFLGVSTVINYDFPGSTTDYIHRCAADSRC